MRTDDDTLKDVIAELKYEPNLRNDDIAVSVRDGVVILAGFVDSYADKWRAETVVGRVNGVKAVANDLEVKLPVDSQRPDPELARTVLDALEWNILVPHENIKVTVENGWVTLRGTVDWYYQKEEAERTVSNLTGVKGVSNLITVAAKPTPSNVKQKIVEALKRGAQFDAERITVAERAARSAPGIIEVENRLTVDPSIPVPV
jgi:osmotically-inducible protein OsmY